MSRFFTEDDLIAAIPGLTRARLSTFVEAEILIPVRSDAGTVYRRIDRPRAELACRLADDFELHEDALSMVLALVDQLHGVRAELRALVQALDSEPADVRRRIGETAFAARRPR